MRSLWLLILAPLSSPSSYKATSSHSVYVASFSSISLCSFYHTIHLTNEQGTSHISKCKENVQICVSHCLPMDCPPYVQAVETDLSKSVHSPSHIYKLCLQLQINIIASEIL